MTSCAAKFAVVVLLLGPAATVALADSPPKLDVSGSCNAAARGAISVGRDKESCLADENAAAETLTQNWSKYIDADKTQCIGNVKTGGPPSYVELLSCLEIMRDAKDIREADRVAPVEGPPAPARPAARARPRN